LHFTEILVSVFLGVFLLVLFAPKCPYISPLNMRWKGTDSISSIRFTQVFQMIHESFRRLFLSLTLRKNHSGMNCCLRQDAVPGRSSREVMRRGSSADAMPGKASGDARLASPG